MSFPYRFGLIGLGNLGSAVTQCLLKSAITDVMICVSSSDKIPQGRNQFPDLEFTASLHELVTQAKTIILCVKPGTILPICKQIAPVLTEDHIVISMAGAVRYDEIVKAISSKCCVVRAMPNLPIANHTGITGIYPSDQMNVKTSIIISRLFGPNRIIPINYDQEELMDSITALSGCGPAFICEVLSQFIQSGTQLGLSPEISQQLVMSTVRGTLDMINARLDTDSDIFNTIQKEVASKGGATERGLLVMKEGTMAKVMEKTHLAARDRMAEVARALTYRED